MMFQTSIFMIYTSDRDWDGTAAKRRSEGVNDGLAGVLSFNFGLRFGNAQLVCSPITPLEPPPPAGV